MLNRIEVLILPIAIAISSIYFEHENKRKQPDKPKYSYIPANIAFNLNVNAQKDCHI